MDVRCWSLVRWPRVLLVVVMWAVTGTSADRVAVAASAEPSTTTTPIDAPEPAKFHGVNLGTYAVRTYYPIEAQKCVVSFNLYATVSDDDAVEFARLLENRREKVRDQVIIATRLVPIADFSDSELTGFRRRILLRLHRMLPELAIQDAYLSDFELEVQSL